MNSNRTRPASLELRHDDLTRDVIKVCGPTPLNLRKEVPPFQPVAAIVVSAATGPGLEPSTSSCKT